MPATKTSTPPRVKSTAALKPYDSAAVYTLIERYKDAKKLSRRVGRPMSFRVDVDPTMDEPNVSPIQEGLSFEAPTFPVEDVEEPGPELKTALSAARERGRLRAAEILSSEEMVNAEAFARLLGTTRATINAKRQSGQVLGLNGAKRGYRFPTWQLDSDGRPFDALPELFDRLGQSPWAVYRFLTSPHSELEGRTGLQALQLGRASSALAVAESISRGDFR